MVCSVKKMEELLAYAEVPPAVNQVEVHPFWRNQKLINFCKQHVSRAALTHRPPAMTAAPSECALCDRWTVQAHPGFCGCRPEALIPAGPISM